ncbi:MAG: ROK family protein [Archangiaceae bacterium]|nr:ROK family protein [Archangiaceae bacterium]
MAEKGATLCIDVGGTGLKMMVVARSGKALSERVRVETPRPATVPAVLRALRGLLKQVTTGYERVSVGFPGVVVGSIVQTAPNLHRSFEGYALGRTLARLTGRPTRVLNDAGVQGHAVIAGEGTELCVTLGTGFGFALYVDGTYVPNIELAHHPFRAGRTYEEYVGNAALTAVGRRKWNRRVRRVVRQLGPIFNYRVLYLGGGNARKVSIELPDNVRRVDNVAGLLGGVRLWERELTEPVMP